MEPAGGIRQAPVAGPAAGHRRHAEPGRTDPAGRHAATLNKKTGTWKKRGMPAPFSFPAQDRKSTRLNSSHLVISYAVFCLKKKKKIVSSDSPVPTVYT